MSTLQTLGKLPNINYSAIININRLFQFCMFIGYRKNKYNIDKNDKLRKLQQTHDKTKYYEVALINCKNDSNT